MDKGQSIVDEDGTKDLADRVSDAVNRGGEVSGFHDEINSLSNQEKLDFIRTLGNSAWQPALNAEGKSNGSIFVDSGIDKKTGAVLDIDLVIFSKDSTVITRRDIYTPNAKGKEYDKRQEMNALASPYRQLLNSMNSPFQNTAATSEECGVNTAYVKRLLEKHTSKHPDKEAIFAAFEEPWSKDKDVEYDYMDSSTDNTKTPAEVKQLIDRYLKTQRRSGANF